MPKSDVDATPRAELHRRKLTVELEPVELHRLISALDAEARVALADPEQEGFAQYLFDRVASLREVVR